jgi:hypothetical protein
VSAKGGGMSISDSGVDYTYDPRPIVEQLKRRLAIRIVIGLSAAGILLVLARWFAS